MNAESQSIAGNVPKGHEARFHQAESPNAAEWARLPAPKQKCQISGLSRSKLAELDPDGKLGIIVRMPRKRGALRATVLVHVPTLRGYLANLRNEAINGKGDA